MNNHPPLSAEQRKALSTLYAAFVAADECGLLSDLIEGAVTLEEVKEFELEAQMEEAFSDSFMQPFIEMGFYYKIETINGTEIVPADLVGDEPTIADFRDYISSAPVEDAEVDRQCGYLTRMSAPGYADCSEWMAFETEIEAMEYLLETFET
jgi:hypothetical protein